MISLPLRACRLLASCINQNKSWKFKGPFSNHLQGWIKFFGDFLPDWNEITSSLLLESLTFLYRVAIGNRIFFFLVDQITKKRYRTSKKKLFACLIFCKKKIILLTTPSSYLPNSCQSTNYMIGNDVAQKGTREERRVLFTFLLLEDQPI